MRISVHNSGHGWNFWKIPSQLEPCVKNLGCGEVLSQFGPSCGLWEAQTCGKCKKTTRTGPFRRLPRAGLWSKLDFFGPKWQTRLDEALGWSIMPIGWWVGRPDLIQWQFPKILLCFAKSGSRFGPPIGPWLRFLKFFGTVVSVFGKWTRDIIFVNFDQPWCCLEAFKPKSHLPGSPRLIKSKSI